MDKEDIALISALMAVPAHKDIEGNWHNKWHEACRNLQFRIAADRKSIADADWDDAIKYVAADTKEKADFIAAMKKKYD